MNNKLQDKRTENNICPIFNYSKFLMKSAVQQESTEPNNLYYPPGGILIWIIIFLELITFAIAMIAMAYYGQQEAVSFHESRLQLNTTYGLVNTIFLVTSGFFMAASVNEFKKDQFAKARRYTGLAMVLGILFLLLKSVEYSAKIDAGLTLGYNTFFSFYWLLTLFHVVHVIVGLVILSFFFIGIKNRSTVLEDLEAGAAFWHMCDLIWILLFPVIYLLF
jgi:nitric oxide reductase NorE protein